MKIRLLREWRRRRPGDVWELPDGVANVLIRRHIAELATEDVLERRPVVLRGRRNGRG